jgi:lysophospholipase
MDDIPRPPVYSLTDCKYFTSAKGITIRYHQWLLNAHQAIGSVILLGGRKEFLEKYIETANDLNRLGFDVYSFDWRGQGLSTRMLSDRAKGFINDYGEYLLDLYEFIDKVVPSNANKPIYFLAHSMGAHIVLLYLKKFAMQVDGAVLSAPMIDIFTDPYPKWLVRLLIRVALINRCHHAVVPGSRKRLEREVHFDNNPLTSDPQRFLVEKKALATNPKLAADAITFAWLSATMKSIDYLKTSDFLETITTPILIVSAGADKVVSVSAQKEACCRLPNCRLTTILDSRHEILMETDVIRKIFWKEFRDFAGIE